ncbi:XRE family transcriptional regulator [Gordonia sp. VNQ95]|uniref:helix-turn-helix domain-containing protein n=1 Tax=Gordonia TaxID=2053 RepID=UPI0032B4E4F7
MPPDGPTAPTALTTAIADAVRNARLERDMTVATLATESAVSRAMITKIERGDAQPTAALLAKLANALGLTLSELIARAENSEARLARRDEQPTWTDPDTGYRRRAVSPSAAHDLELVEVDLPPGSQVSYPAESYRFIDQQIWVLAGTLRFDEGPATHELHPGDCLSLGAPAPCRFHNPSTTEMCRYLVVLHKVSRPR